MPEYLAPGVYVEETSFRAKSIEGVGTSTTAFVGPARKGPFVTADTPDDDLEPPEILTSFADFERMYGSLEDLQLGGTRVPNYLAHAVRSYFNEGGSRLYVARIFAPNGSTDTGAAAVVVRTDAAEAERVTLRARFPGRVGSGAVDAVETTAQVSRRTLQAAPEGSLLRRTQAGTPATVTLFVKVGQSWFAVDGSGVAGTATDLATAADGGELQLLTLAIVTSDGDAAVTVYDDMGYDSRHPRYVGRVLDATPSRRAEQLENLYALDIGAGVNAFELHAALFAGGAVRGRRLPGAAHRHGRRRQRCHRRQRRRRADLGGLREGPAQPAQAGGRGHRRRAWFRRHRRPCRGAARPHRPCRIAPGVSHRRARHRGGHHGGRGARRAGADRFHPRRALLPLGGGGESAGAAGTGGHSEGDRAAAVRLRLRHLCPQRHRARRRQGAGQRGGARRPALRARRELRRSRNCSTRWASTACASSPAAATASGAPAPSARIPSGSMSTCGATSTTWRPRSTAAPSGRCSSPTASGCGRTCGRPSTTSSTTSGATARCSAPRPSRRSSSAATARP